MPTNGSADFGTMLRERRKSVSLTQEELAERAGISARAIADVERGVIRAPRRDTLELLADALELTDQQRDEWRQLRRQLSMRSSGDTPAPSLPHPPNQLIGRDREVNALVNLVTQSDTRLVTVTGPGGVGKTRIGLAAGHALQDRFSDGVYFVELASVRAPELLLPTIAQHLGIRGVDPSSIQQRLFRYLAQRDHLLILDNAEHLRTASADVSALLANTSGLHLLVTSRAGLRIGAEHEFPVGPLRLPAWDGAREIAGLQSYPGIELFIQRARQARPDFALTSENAESVSRICAWLDGLPLAIELAAARVKILPPEQMIPHLADRLGFLTSGLADAPDRHQTMRAAIDWSYDLLEEVDQRAFRMLSTFVGGWSLEAADAVAPASVDIIDCLGRLANDNLVIQSSQPHEQVRFHMLETVREFGLEKLQELGERNDAMHRHACHFLELAERADPELRGPEQGVWLDRLETEMANLRVALETVHQPDLSPEAGLRMVAALTWFWETRGHVSEGRSWLIRSIGRDSEPTGPRMKALVGAGWFAHIQQDSPAAYECLHEGYALANALGDRWWEAWVLHLLGSVAYFDGDADAADRNGEESLKIARELDDPWIIAWDEHLFGLADFIRDDLPATRKHYQRSLEIRESIGYPEGICLINGLLGVLTLREGDSHAALDQFLKGLEVGYQIGARWLVINWTAHIVFITADFGDSERAARLAGFVESMSDLTGAFPIPISNATLQRGIEIARNQLGDDVYETFHAAGQRLTMDDVLLESQALADELAAPG